MNTTPLISKTPQVPYTIVGEKNQDKKKSAPPFLTILLVNRSGKFYREELLKDTIHYRFAETVCMEGPDVSYEIEPLMRKFPEVRFILLKDRISDGEKINLGIKESRSRFVFVIFSDMKIQPSSFADHILVDLGKKAGLCTVPTLFTSKHEIVPSIQVPGYIKKEINLLPWEPSRNFCKSLFPFDYCGIYDKERFERLGGYDREIVNTYWQKIDFGFRSFLWGEEIRLNKDIHVHYLSDILTENVTPDDGYKRFYLKNIYVDLKNGKGTLPLFKFFHYLFHSGTDPVSSLKEFLQIRKWVSDKSFQFRKNARNLITAWETP